MEGVWQNASMTESATACFRHPEQSGPVLKCRHCDHWACAECRENQLLGGTGIPIVVCATCVAKQARKRALRKAMFVVVVVLVVGALVAASTTPVFMLVPLALSALWGVYYWRRVRSGTANAFTYAGLLSIFSRFLP
jgi:hypothetical protein